MDQTTRARSPQKRDADTKLAQQRLSVLELDLHRFCSDQVLMLGGPLFEGHG